MNEFVNCTECGKGIMNGLGNVVDEAVYCDSCYTLIVVDESIEDESGKMAGRTYVEMLLDKINDYEEVLTDIAVTLSIQM